MNTRSEENRAQNRRLRDGIQKKREAGPGRAPAKGRFEKDERKAGKREKEAGCPYQKKCGGCDYQGMPYEKQLQLKQEQVKKLLSPFCRVQPITGMKEPAHYRHKVHAVLARAGGRVISGVYEEKTHRVVPVSGCQIENEKADAIIQTVTELVQAFKMKVYDEDSGYGLFRHVLVRVGYASGEIMVVLVLASPILPDKNHFVKELKKRHPEITTIVLNVNDKKTSMVLGKRDIVLDGRGYIEDSLCGCHFRISPQSFYQVNPVQTELLYQRAIQAARLTGAERVIDAYCGTGTIGLIAAGQAKEVIGVELTPDAVRDAIWNAKRNQIRNARFYCGDAGEFMTDLKRAGESADVVFLDPPRSGSTEIFLTALSELMPRRIVYVSCNPETLARDLAVLTRRGYRAKEAWPYDLFPETQHCEVVVEIVRRE